MFHLKTLFNIVSFAAVSFSFSQPFFTILSGTHLIPFCFEYFIVTGHKNTFILEDNEKERKGTGGGKIEEREREIRSIEIHYISQSCCSGRETPSKILRKG